MRLYDQIYEAVNKYYSETGLYPTSIQIGPATYNKLLEQIREDNAHIVNCAKNSNRTILDIYGIKLLVDLRNFPDNRRATVGHTIEEELK